MTSTTDIRMPGTPPAWVNATMRFALFTPLVQRMVGRMFAIITVTGSKTGKRYSTPVQYLHHDGELVVLSQRMRRWWKNIANRPDVEMRIKGRALAGKARIAERAEALDVLADCLGENPRVARFYGVEPDDAGEFAHDDLVALLDQVVVIVVTPEPVEVELTPADVVMEPR